MNHGIPQSVIPAVPGLEKEEPEIGYEEDIPSDDAKPAAGEPDEDEQALRDVERE
jgi:hypothetical protein